MSNTSELICKSCGAQLDLSKAVNGVVKCAYCRRMTTLPKENGSPIAFNFLRHGEHDLDTCKFDDAYTAYAKAAEYDKDEPEAYWGMALAEFKVQYIKDTRENRLQPICHEITDKCFEKNRNYLTALQYATPDQKKEYTERAREIDYVRAEFLKLKQSGLNYDCFICVKVSRLGEQTDINKKNWTDDAYDADSIYDLLKRNGYSPFYSEREIRGRSGADYEAMILYALYTAETMLIVCRNEEYLQTPWVKNEYTRFKELVNNKEKENDSLTFVYNGKPIEKLPGSNGKIQGIDYSRREADFEIVKFVENHTPAARAKREAEKRRKQEESEALKKQIEAQIEEQKKVQRELEKKLNSINSGASGGAGATVNSLLTRARQEVGFRDFNKAKEYLNKVLDVDPNNADGWFGLFLTEFGVADENEICDSLTCDLVRKVSASRNLKSAEKYATEEIKQRIQNFTKRLNSPESRWKLFLDELSVTNESELLDAMSVELLNSVEKNENYNAVLKDAEGDVHDRAVKFRLAMYSGEVWWKGLLKQYNASSGSDLIARATNQQLCELPENPYYQHAYKFASGDFSAIMNAFIGELFSFRLWWGRLLADYDAETEEEILFNFKYEYRNIPKSNPCFLRAKKYANENEKEIIDRFEQGLLQHENEYNLARASWAKLLKEFKCTDEIALSRLNKSIADSHNYRDAYSHACNSKDKELIDTYSTIARSQGESAEENRANLSKERLTRARIAIFVVTILIAAVVSVTGILSYINIEPFGSFWFRLTSEAFGTSSFRWLVIVVPLAYIVLISLIVGLVGGSYRRKSKGKNIFVIFLSCIFIVAVALMGGWGYTMTRSTQAEHANYLETELSIINLTEDEEKNSYTVSSVYIKDKEANSVIVPATFNGKPVTVIGEKAFRNSKVEYVTLGKNITHIENSAFEQCINLKSINIPESVKYIGSEAFNRCNSSAKLNFARTTGWYSIGAGHTYSGGKAVDSANLKPENAAKYFNNTIFYFYHN